MHYRLSIPGKNINDLQTGLAGLKKNLKTCCGAVFTRMWPSSAVVSKDNNVVIAFRDQFDRPTLYFER